MVTLGQIAYEAHFREAANNYALLSTRHHKRWQRSAEAVLAVALDDLRRRERELAEARKPCPCKVRDAAIDAAIDAAMGGE